MSLELQKKELLHVLSSHQQVSYEELADRLSVSIRSIKLLIESLLYQYGHIFSIQDRQNQLSLSIYDQEAFRSLVTEHLLQDTDFNSFHKRQALCFRILLDAEHYVSADDVAEKLGISRRSLTRDMQRMKQVLESYHLDLQSKPGVGIRLVGKELHKRLLYLYEVMDYLEEKVDLPQEVYDTYVDIIKSQHLPLDVERSFLKTLVLTWKRRQFTLEEDDFRWFTWRAHLDFPPIFYEVVAYYWQRPINQLERYFLTFPMQLGLIAAEVERSDIYHVTRQVLALTVEEYGVQLDMDDSAALLQRHIVYMLNRSIMKWEFTEVGLRQDLLRSTFSYVVSQFFIDRVSEQLGLSISRREVVLLAAWMDLLLTRNSKPLIAKIAVISQAGLSFNRLVDNQIRQVFGSDVTIDFLEFINHPPYEQLSEKYDVVFTDNLLYSQELFQSFLSLTVVTKENREEREKMERMVLARKIQLYCQVWTVDFQENHTYEENLAGILALLEKKGTLSSALVEKLQEKEKKSPALSDTGFAFPHVTVPGLERVTLICGRQSDIHLDSQQTGAKVTDFILLLIPDSLEELQHDLLYQLFDNTFRLESQSTIKERLGIIYMEDLPHLEEEE